MITRILSSRLPLMIHTPVKVFDLPYFQSIANAGALPVFDTEFLEDQEILQHVKTLAKETFAFGIRLARADQNLIDQIKQEHISTLDALLVPLEKDNAVPDLSGMGDTKIMAEVRHINIQEQIAALDPHGLVLRGNEAPGKVSQYSSFILMQWYLENNERPIFIHGGAGHYTSAGLLGAGASGLVLDSQVLLCEESPVSDNFKKLLLSVDEGDSTEIQIQGHDTFRVFAKPGTKIVKDLKEQAALADGDKNSAKIYKQITNQIQDQMTPLNHPDANFVQSLFYLGQDAVFAKNFIKDSKKLKDIVEDFFTAIGQRLNLVDEFDPIVPDSALAKDHNTRLPLIQGPMANISDTPEFAVKVLEQGALPFLAVGSLPQALAQDMVDRTTKILDNFGAGLVGIEAFNPAVNEHLELIKSRKVPYALFAGGIPSQVLELEKAGTKTYLHTPSVSMMDNAIANGCSRFIFEGGEAGGHVGVLSSLVLWEEAIASLIRNERDLSSLSLIFAGGISTLFASCFISSMTAFLAAKGAKIGIQAGTAYLFSHELVQTKAVKKQYQDILLENQETVVIGKSLGLASRTATTPFAKATVELENRMILDKVPLSERKRTFEKNNIGSLLIGAKGFLPDFDKPGKENFIWFDDDSHREKGNFLTGDSLAFFDTPLSIQEIHDVYMGHKTRLYRHLNQWEILTSPRNRIHDEIAVVGMGCVLPDADSPQALWENILNKKYSISEMPKERLDKELYWSEDKTAEDRTYTVLAGHIKNFEFDAERFGYSKEKAEKLSRSQQMLLHAAYQAVENANMLNKDNTFACKDPGRTAVVIATCLSNELCNDIQLKYWFPEILSMLESTDEYKHLSQKDAQKVKDTLQKGIEGKNTGYDPIHGVLLNIEASRIAKHLGIRGINYVVDAACASSMTALDAAVGELLSGEYDEVIVGGVNTDLAPESFIGFAKMGAISAAGSFPFDQRANGFVLGEGAVIFVLKRMKDALRDKDNIVGIINAIGSSSDGRGKAIAAPNPAGQLLSISRCFDNIREGITPEDIEFLEAHGTSTIIGDQAEINTLKNRYGKSHAGISSIKSQIGHLLGCAGAAGLLKTLLALNNGILPPNGQFETLADAHDLSGTDLFIIKDEQPWETKTSRKAAISSYGFGGINYHMAVEQMTENYCLLPRKIFSDITYDFNDDRIVAAGLGVLLPGASNTDEFWEKLVSGQSQLSKIPPENFDNAAYSRLDKKSVYYLPDLKAGVVKNRDFNYLQYRMPPKMTPSIEIGQIFGLEAAGQALTSSGLINKPEGLARTGVILGTISGERQSKNIIRCRKTFITNCIRFCSDIDADTANRLADSLMEVIRTRIPANNEDTTPGLLSNIISGRIANHFNLTGANYVLDASCASAGIAMRNAARSVKQKDLDFVLTGGVDCNLFPAVLMAFKNLGLLSENDCHFFDKRSQGYVMGEGAAIHVLTTYKKAKDAGMTIFGEINACGVHSSVPDHLLSPSESAFVTAIDKTYRNCGIRKQDIDHLDLFAFSNVVGDMVENQAVKASFSHAMNCGNVKPQFGYFKAANPAVALAKLMLMASHGKILPNFHFDEEYSTMKGHNLLIPGKKIQDRKPGQPLRFASNINGIGGNHLHIIMGSLPAILEPEKTSGTPARQPAASNPLPQNAYSSDAEGKKLRMVALLSGQGAQYSGMMKELFHADAHIRKIMEQGEAIFQEQRGYSLLELMFGEHADNTDKGKDLNATNNTQPAVFLSSAAIYSRLALEGFAPDYYIGHSVGEYTALYCSGILNFDHAMRLIIKRSELMYQSTLEEPGKIMVVFTNEKNTGKLIQESGISDIYITNKNSEKQTAVSGKAQSIEDFCLFLKAQKVMFKKLNLTGAFHTPLLKGASEQLRTFLDTLDFAPTNYGRIISNTLAAPYPKTSGEVKDLLARQIVSPVEFIKSVEYVYASGKTHFVEIGPAILLVNLLKDINIGEYGTTVTVDRKKGELASFTECRDYLAGHNALFTAPAAKPEEKDKTSQAAPKPEDALALVDLSDEFEDFKRNNQKAIDKILFEEFQRRKRDAAIEALERFEFNTRPVVISGVSVGLPGKTRHVFAKDNFDAILNGKNFIESLDQNDQERLIDKNIIKLYKQPDGNARFVQITKTEDVIHLAGQLGYFNLNDEYGIKEEYDIAMALGIAAGIEALKDANIPLVMQYKSLKDGRTLVPDGFALPEEMQEDTGVIITSLWPNGETLMEELEKYFYERFFLKPYEEFEKIYYFLMEKVEDNTIKDKLTDWFFAAKSGKRKEFTTYSFDRNFLANACPLGSAHLAKIIKAKGPNTLVSSACASTTLAIGIAEDWIRVGRCKRVLVVGGENATSSRQSQWVGTGFLALGAATIKKRVSEAAKPFDEDRNGTILGAGAVGLVIEDARETARRGMNGQCEILGTHIANSAYHTYNIDVPHMSKEMTKFIDRVERQHGISKKDYADKLLFMSHETYTPARGGSADAEVQVLESTFSDHLNNICISNTKGFTGHTLGAAIEDVVLVKALQKRKAPPIANLQKIPANFQRLNFSGQDKIAAEYGMHLSAGFGSHFAFIFVKRRQENPVQGNQTYAKWVQEITDCENPELKIIDNTLCAVAQDKERSNAPGVPAKTAAPIAKTAEASGNLLEKVKQIIAEQTGYTTDLLANDLDLEADLGIDTVKQVEIFGRIAAEFGFDVPDDLKLRDLNTIEKLADYVARQTGNDMDAAPQGLEASASGGMETVKAIIAEQTGYTTDLLANDLDLEADLGIDTVKQVEIFGRIAAEFGFDVPDDLKLRDLNTIEKLADYVARQTGGAIAVAASPDDAAQKSLAPSLQSSTPEKTNPAIKRLVPRITKLPALEASKGDFSNHTFLVSLDQKGWGQKITRKIQGLGGKVITLGSPAQNPDIAVDMTNIHEMEALAPKLAKKHPGLTGFIHLAPLDFYGQKTDLDTALNASVTSAFILIKNVYELLNARDSLIAALTLDSVVLPYMEDMEDTDKKPVFPIFAGVSGLFKTVNKEMEATRVKVVDCSLSHPDGESEFDVAQNRVIDQFIQELLGTDNRCEVGWKNDKRYGLCLQPESPEQGESIVSEKDTILVTGGAGGITFEILKKMASVHKTGFIILGRSDIHGTDPDLLVPSLGQADIMEKIKAARPQAKPLEIKQETEKIIRIRKAAENIQALKDMGVDVTYHCADVRDKEKVKQLIDSHDKIDGILHAAGVELSQFIPKKETRDFQLVLDVKTKGLSHLLSAMKDRKYKYFFTFSSVTAYFGNQGQADYTAANDVLAKTLLEEQRNHPERKYKVYAWTAWEDAGMAARATVQKVLKARGIQFLPLAQGVECFMEELKDSRKTEVLFSGMDDDFDPDGILQHPEQNDFPFLDKQIDQTPDSATWTRLLTLERDVFLKDHTMGDVPLFLGATGIETLAQAARKLADPSHHIIRMTDFHIPYGIKLLKGRPKEIIIQGKKTSDTLMECQISSVFKNPAGQIMGDPTLHYQGTFAFSKTPIEAPQVEAPTLSPVSFEGSVEELIYHPQRLFMKGLFATIRKITSFDGETLVVKVSDTSNAPFFKGITQPRFQTWPVLIDAMFQTGGLLEFLTTSQTVLPYKIASMEFYNAPKREQIYYCVTKKISSNNDTNIYSLRLVDEQGNVYIGIENFEMVKMNLNILEPEYQIADKVKWK